MAKLNEDVLRHIFEYLTTPLDWIQVSQVCRLWKLAASKQWRRITGIHFETNLYTRKSNPDDRKHAPMITAVEAKKIMLYCAPFVKVLSGTCIECDKNDRIMFGPFLYNVQGIEIPELLKFFSQIATNISEISFNLAPPLDVLKLLISRNSIKKINFEMSFAFYEHIRTDTIEELNLNYGVFESANVKSFSGHFPNLKTLNLEIYVETPTEPQVPLMEILPYIDGVTSLRLCLQSKPRSSLSCKTFSDVGRYSQLEHLVLLFFDIRVSAFDFFIKKVARGCQKLRSIKLSGINLTEKHIQTLLTLPSLESLDISSVSSLQSIKLPKCLNLSNLRIVYKYEKFNTEFFCEILRKMPKLSSLAVKSNDSLHTMDLFCEVAQIASSQKRNIVVETKYYFVKNNYLNKDRSQTLKIVRKGFKLSDKKARALNITLSFGNDVNLIDSIKAFVKNNLKSYRAFVEECKD